MMCKPGDHVIYPTLTEEFILNEEHMGACGPRWRRFRIEYGFECGCPEGVIYTPPEVDPEWLEMAVRDAIMKSRWLVQGRELSSDGM